MESIRPRWIDLASYLAGFFSSFSAAFFAIDGILILIDSKQTNFIHPAATPKKGGPGSVRPIAVETRLNRNV
jgi:hypothetical protein